MSELLLGCGWARKKNLVPPGCSKAWTDLVTVDNNPDVNPDYLFNLNGMAWDWHFGEQKFTEIHAYEVLEHLGEQGDMELFFNTFDCIWRLLLHGGFLCASTPSRHGPWLWGDPSHRRAIIPETLIFLDQTEYEKQAGKTSMSDFRYMYKSDFKCVHCQDDGVTHSFVLQAIHPARLTHKPIGIENNESAAT